MKRNKSLRVLLTLALVAVVCLGTMTTAFAADDLIEGSETNPAQAVIVKHLQMPDGTTTPVANFMFAFAAKSVDGDSTAAALATMPAIIDKPVAFAGTETGTSAAGVKTVESETGSLFSGVQWPHAGVYTYTVTESAGTATGMTYSSGSYDISVYVANGTGGLYIAAIGTVVAVVDHAGQNVGDKTDPSTITTVSGISGAMVFTNTYIHTPNIDDPTTGDALSISKTVSGAYGNRDTLYFPFTVNLTEAALVPGTNYKAYVMEGTTVATMTTDNYSGTPLNDIHGDYIEVTPGTPININLKHGQRLAFMGLPVGTTYSVTEAAVPDYTPSASVVVNGGTAIVSSGTVNTSLSVGSPNAIVIGDGANKADFTNTYKSVTPTGISLDNLPFILLIVLAVGALTTFVVVRIRKRARSAE